MIAAPRKERGVRSLDFSKFHEAPKAVETAEKSLAEHPAPAPPEPPRRMNLNALSKRANEAIEIAASIQCELEDRIGELTEAEVETLRKNFRAVKDTWADTVRVMAGTLSQEKRHDLA
jgi:hypothetical protein